MKVIDLLNKIANSADVPNKIKFHNNIFIFDKSDMTYYLENSDKNLFSICNYKILSDEVEIIEEKPKKIDEWGEPTLEEINKCDLNLMEINRYLIVLVQTQQELIEAVNYLLEKSDSE